MNMIQFGIASIVDANTGNGLVHGGSRPDYASLENRGRRIRSKSVLDLFQVIGHRVAVFFENQRAKAKARRDLNQLLRLNDHLLDDIGLQRNDLYLVQSGEIKLEELRAGYRSQYRHENSLINLSAQSETPDSALKVTNEQFYEMPKCA